MTQKLVLLLSLISCSMFSINAAAANVIVQYDAVTAGAGVLPDGVSPPWQWVSNVPFGMEMTNDGTKLTQDWTSDDPTTSYENFVSPPTGGLMFIGSDGYGIEFKARPLSDMPTTDPNGNPYGLSHYANFMVGWSDDYYTYTVSPDLDADDSGPGTIGALRTAKNQQIIAADNIDWSVPHTVFVGYYGPMGSQGIFKFYVDGTLASTFTPSQIGGSHVVQWQDRVMFGDATSGQPAPYAIDVKGEWYFVKIYDSSSPPGACGDPNTHPYSPGDLNLDCVVDVEDLKIIAEHWLDDNRVQ